MFAAAVRGIEPVILSLGAAAFAALGQDSDPMHDVSHFEWKNIFGWLKGDKTKVKEPKKPNRLKPRQKKAKETKIPKSPEPVKTFKEKEF